MSDLTIAVLGGHSALDVCHGAKKYGYKTIAVCQKGREKTYSEYYKTRGNKGCVDETIILNSFHDLINDDIQEKIHQENAIFIHSRYFWVYFDFNDIEHKLNIPIFGARSLLKMEERTVKPNQYDILQSANIRYPKLFLTPNEIDRLVIIKAQEKARSYERAFFFAQNPADYYRKREQLIKNGQTTEESMQSAIIEEFIIGAPINLNFFYSPLTKELELMGLDMRRQTNLDGLLRLPADEQIKMLEFISPKMIETGHIACTSKESLLEKFFDLGEKFVETTQKLAPPGIIGPFALQGAVTAEEGKEDIVIFDVSMRIPGSPGTRFTPYSGYLYGNSISYGERIAMEIKEAIKQNRLYEILT